jgi:hypothetical protein
MYTVDSPYDIGFQNHCGFENNLLYECEGLIV